VKNSKSPKSSPRTVSKKAYRRPKVVVHGDVRTLTRTGPRGGTRDLAMGATFS
jgi:hypothetical protein